MRTVGILFFVAAAFCIYKHFERNQWKEAQSKELKKPQLRTRVEYSSDFSNPLDYTLPLITSKYDC